ncbi:SDR family NAD(P)-dependent oxidoreductase [Bacillus sp. CHD6a]|uniref:SDR family NAD(P)-dependent oxidoreductase n=1 Tax=Bacillus sp. CHD6a TaxID=1643452 RepID=UPI0006CCCAB8|nr:SDR family NAD(P)-dependent oxidoreductase [Bacillus sp. CHD6a]KPB05948.1 short-chain dehydrogenase [Bacillus sp. CHD6a]
MNNKVMLIVGAGPGISLSTAKKFGREGYKIAMIARREEALNQYTEELKSMNIEAKGFKGDVSEEDSLQTAIHEVINTLGKIDVLLYNAAAGTPGKPTTLKTEDLINDFKISVAGALVSVKEVLPHMENGTILFTGGGLALTPYADYASLAVGKAGIRNLAYSLAQELSQKETYLGLLTVNGFVKEGTSLSPDHVAEEFYNMNTNRTELEIILENH